MIGTTLGNYRITQKIGQGGVGEVWKAVDLSLDREVALKVLRPELAAQPSVVARFRTEALALARLNHPHVATIHGFHTEGETPFIVMEYIPGQTLHVIVRGFGRMQTARALPLFFQVLDAIGHAHDHGIVHRDLKASNVMMSHLGVLKMLDFGIARVLGSAGLTTIPTSIGTPAWMAPEQVRGEEADVRTDVYALGLLLYWLTTARLPFEHDNPFDLQRAHVEAPPPPPRNFAPDLPDAIEKSILRALAKERTERFACVAELQAALGDGFVPALTIPVVGNTVEATIHHAQPVSEAAERDATRPQAPIDAPARAPAVANPVLHFADPGATLAIPVPEPASPVAASAPTPASDASSRWLPMTLLALLLALAVGVVALRQPPQAPRESDPTRAAATVPPAPEVLAPAPAPPAPALAPAVPSRAAAARPVPSPKRKAAPRPSGQGDEGWVIKR